MTDKRTFRLVHENARKGAMRAVAEAPDGHVVIVKKPTRSLDQNSKFHAICYDLERSGFPFRGRARSLQDWKVLLVSAHAVATKHESEVEEGIEGEPVQLRESTADMSVARKSSLIEYALAFCAMNGVLLKGDACEAVA